jgi:hypothetical protein
MRTLTWLFGEKKKPVRDAEAQQKERTQEPDSMDACNQRSCQEMRSTPTRNLR